LQRGAAIRHEGGNTKQNAEKFIYHQKVIPGQVMIADGRVPYPCSEEKEKKIPESMGVAAWRGTLSGRERKGQDPGGIQFMPENIMEEFFVSAQSLYFS
jgi:hypothetical protein